MTTPSSIQKVIRDILDLCELQVELLSIDSQAAKRKLLQAVVCGVTAATLAGSALTVVLVGLGFVLHELTDLSTGGGLLIVGAAAFLVTLFLLVGSVLAVKAAAAAMRETKSEFAENLRWLKATLVSPQTAVRNQIRKETFSHRSKDDSDLSDRFHSVSTSPF